MFRWLVLTVVFLPAASLADRSPTLLVLGDSLSAAYGLSAERGWVALLQRRLTDAGHPHRVVNASVSGETTAGGLTRLPALIERQRPAVLIVQLGANDGLRGLALEETRSNLTRIVRLAQESGARVLLIGIRLPPNYGAAFYERFQAIFPEVAADTGVALVPRLLEGVAEDRDLMQPDGLHPVAEAQPLILDNVWPVLASLLSGGGVATSP